jgi:hypothetical protein
MFMCIASLHCASALAQVVQVVDQDGKAIATAMVTRTQPGADIFDTSDNGYPEEGFVNRVVPRQTRFTNADGMVEFSVVPAMAATNLRVRAQGFRDAHAIMEDAANLTIRLERIREPLELAESKPSNLWLSQLKFDWADDPPLAREHFLKHCGFCHQQASPFMRLSRTEQQWADILQRMNV